MSTAAGVTTRIPRPGPLPKRDAPDMGDGQTISLAALPEAAAARVQALYRFLTELHSVTMGLGDKPTETLATLRSLDEAPLTAAFETAQQLGVGVPNERKDLHKALHDVRGGSLTALLTHLDLIHMGIAKPVDAERVHLLVRDHLKMMRNAIFDLDPVLHAADLADKHHGMDLLVQKWSKADYPVGDRQVSVALHTTFEGVVSERCMEFSSLDRVLYNLVNNAARFTVDGQVRIEAEPVTQPDATHLRFAVVNKVSPEQVATLQEAFGGQLGRVFEGGFTTGGHGLGLAVCADLVRHAYSLKSGAKAVQDHVLGAALVDGHYVAWFHWPAIPAEAA